MSMAKKSVPTTPKTPIFDYLYIFTWALMPLVYPMFEAQVQDAGLYPRVALLALVSLVGGILLFTQKAKALPFLITLAAIAFFVVWHFAGYSNAIAKSLFWATLSRNTIFFAYLLLTYQLLRNGLLSFGSVVRSGLLFVAISALSILPDLLKVLTGGNYTREIYQATGWFTHKNFAASALLMSIPFIYLATHDKNKVWQKTAMITMGVVILEIVFLRTRGVWLGFLAGIGATVLMQLLSKQKETRQLRLIGISSAAFVVLLAVVFMGSGSAEKILDTRNIDVRFMYWQRSVTMAQEAPLTGIGAGNWTINFPKYGLQGTNQSVMKGETTVDRPHNDMLWVLAEMGIPAWIALAAFQILLLLMCVKLLNHTDGEKRNQAMATIFGLIAFGVYGLGEFPIERPVTVGLLVLLAAQALRLAEEEGLTKKPLFLLPANVAAGLIIGLAVFGLWVSKSRIDGEKGAYKAVQGYLSRNPAMMLQGGTEAQNRFFEIDIFNSPMQYFTGLGYLANNRFAEAEQEFLQGLEVNPYHINTMRLLGDSYKFQKQYDKALLRYNEALAISPRFYMASMSKVEIYLAQNDVHAALKALNTVSYKTTDYPKFKQLGLQVLQRFGQEPSSDFMSELHAVVLNNSGSPDQLWQAYLDFKKSKRK
jgi:O-antigen ligase